VEGYGSGTRYRRGVWPSWGGAARYRRGVWPAWVGYGVNSTATTATTAHAAAAHAAAAHAASAHVATTSAATTSAAAEGGFDGGAEGAFHAALDAAFYAPGAAAAATAAHRGLVSASRLRGVRGRLGRRPTERQRTGAEPRAVREIRWRVGGGAARGRGGGAVVDERLGSGDWGWTWRDGR